jgi:cholesterol oxidase
MKGYFSKSAGEDHAAAYEKGKADGSPFEFTLTITAEDLGAMLKDREHRAKMIGSVTAPALSPHPLTATEGEFRLFSRFPHKPATLWMHYRMKLSARDGARYFFEGSKRIHDDPGLDLWADTTTLYVTVHEGGDPHGPVIGRGILRIRILDFLKQMLTFHVVKPRSWWAAAWASMRFYAFFTKNLLYVFGGPLTRRLLRGRRRKARGSRGPR